MVPIVNDNNTYYTHFIRVDDKTTQESTNSYPPTSGYERWKVGFIL